MPECFRTLQVEIQFISTVTVRQLPAGALPAQMRAAHVWLSAASATAEHLKTWEPAAVLSCNRTRTAPARGFHTEPDRETVAWAAYLWPCWQVADRPLSSLACSVCTYLQRSSPEHRWDTRILITLTLTGDGPNMWVPPKIITTEKIGRTLYPFKLKSPLLYLNDKLWY